MRRRKNQLRVGTLLSSMAPFPTPAVANAVNPPRGYGIDNKRDLILALHAWQRRLSRARPVTMGE
jgi:hypothetical protein